MFASNATTFADPVPRSRPSKTSLIVRALCEDDHRTPFVSARVTPGEADVQPAPVTLAWRDCRFLKATADDLSRPPHALEYVLDIPLTPAGKRKVVLVER